MAKETVKETPVHDPFAGVVFKKKTVRTMDFPRDARGKPLKEGAEIIGVFESISSQPFSKVENGEVVQKEFRSLMLSMPGEEGLYAWPCDAGLLKQLKQAGVRKGDVIKARNLGKQDIKDGRTLNEWDLFVG